MSLPIVGYSSKSEAFRLVVYDRAFLHHYGDVGSYPYVSTTTRYPIVKRLMWMLGQHLQRRVTRWRSCGSDLRIPLLLGRIHCRRRISLGARVGGSDGGWAVPLDLRAGTSQVPQIRLLHYWSVRLSPLLPGLLTCHRLAMRLCMASRSRSDILPRWYHHPRLDCTQLSRL